MGSRPVFYQVRNEIKLHYHKALVLILIIWISYLYTKTLHDWHSQVDRINELTDMNHLQVRDDMFFVAVVEHHNDSSRLLRIAKRSWLQNVNSEVFTKKPMTWFQRYALKLPEHTVTEVGEARWISSYVSVKHRGYPWYVISRLSSFVVFQNLKRFLRRKAHTLPTVGVVRENNGTWHMIVANEYGLNALANVGGCNVGLVEELLFCLDSNRILRKIDLLHDDNGDKAYLLQEKDSNGTVVNTELNNVSRFMHSYHNLDSTEMSWFQAILFGVRRQRGIN